MAFRAFLVWAALDLLRCLPCSFGFVSGPTFICFRSSQFQNMQAYTRSSPIFMSIDEEALLEYLDDGDAGRISFEEFKELQQRERYLLECPLFQRCSPSDVSRIAKCMIPQNLTAGERLIEQGASGNFMYFLVQGLLEAVKKTNETDALIVATYSEPGTVFGELALLFDQPRAATVTATADSLVYRLDKAAFLDSVVESPIYQTAKGIILKKYQSQRLVDILPKVRLDEVAALLAARLLGRFSTKRLAKATATFSLGVASVLITKAFPMKVSMIPWVYLLLGLVGYMLN